MTRIVLDLEQRVEFTASQLSSPDRLMIELRGKDRPGTVGKVTEVADPAAAPVVVATRTVAEPAPKAAAPRKFEPPPHTEVARAEVPASLPAELMPPPPMAVMAKPTKLPTYTSLSTSLSMKNDLPPPPGTTLAPVVMGPPEKTERTKTPGFESEPAKRNSNGERSLTRVLGLKLGTRRDRSGAWRQGHRDAWSFGAL